MIHICDVLKLQILSPLKRHAKGLELVFPSWEYQDNNK